MRSRSFGILALRLVMLAAGPLLLGFSIAAFYWVGLGADPTSVLADGVHAFTGLSQSNASTAVNVAMLLLLLCLDRKKIGLATVVCAVFVGPCIGLAQELLFFRVPAPGLVVGVIVVAVSAVVNSLGLGLYLSAGFGSSAFDGLILFLRAKTGLSYQNALWAFYAVVFVIGVIMGGVWGVGTLVSLILSGPSFQFFYGRLSAWAERTFCLSGHSGEKEEA